MASKSILWLWLCLFISAILTDSSPPVSQTTCFASNNASPDENYEACCPHQANKPQNGAGSVSSAQFTYECGYYPDPFGNKVDGEVSNMQDCAAHCAKDPTCVAGAWNPGCCDPKKCTPGFCGMCYLTTKMDGKKRAKGPGWVLLETALHKCKEDERACQTKAKVCESERTEYQRQEAAIQTKLAECETEKTELGKTCSTQIENAREQGRMDEEAKCKLDKDVLTDNLNTKCEQEKSSASEQGRLDCVKISGLDRDLSANCPSTDESQITVDSALYWMYCNQRFLASTDSPHLRVKNFRDCLAHCSRKPESSCIGVTYYHEFYGDTKEGGCALNTWYSRGSSPPWPGVIIATRVPKRYL